MYKSKLLIKVSGLLIIVIMTMPGCGQGTPTEQPPICVGIVVSPPQPETIVEPVTGNPPESLPYAGQPPSQSILPEDKPALIMSVKDPKQVPPQMDTSHIIGFVFPGGKIAIKAAAMKAPYATKEGCVVGVVEMGDGASQLPSGIYTVTIDLSNPEQVVAGILKSFPENTSQSPISITFNKTPLVRNEAARPNSDSFPPLNAIITANSVCFVIGLTDSGEVTIDPLNAFTWTRYCSMEPLLSVQGNYSEAYANMQKDLQGALDHISQQYPNLTIDNLALETTISEMEDPEDIKNCNANGQANEQCNPDITGTATRAFWSDYDNAKAASNGGDFAATAGIVKVWRTINFNGGSVDPGDYWVMFWFNSDETFLGATLLGVTNEGKQIEGQTIPATPSYFLDADNSRKIVSAISAWHLGNWCICWQQNCP